MRNKTHPITIAIGKAFAEIADPVNALAMQKYMKSAMPYYGVKTPQQRAIRNSIFKTHNVNSFEEYEKVILELWNGRYREERYAAIACAAYYTSHRTPEALQLYRMMIETGAWWDYVDGLSTVLISDLLKRYPDFMRPELYKWIDDPDMWVRRAAILAQEPLKSSTDERMLFEFCLKCIDERVFWIAKAIGWVLRSYSKSNPFAVRRFVEYNHGKMSTITLREASKYI